MQFSLSHKTALRSALVVALDFSAGAFSQSKAPASAVPTAAASVTPSTAKPDASSPTSLDTARAPLTTKSTLPPLTLPQQIARMPPLTGTGIDVAAQGKAILNQMN